MQKMGFMACVVFGDGGNNAIVVLGEHGAEVLTASQALEWAEDIATHEGEDAPGVVALTQLAAMALRKGVKS